MGAERLKIGISACFFHADPERPIFTGKTLQYIEQSIAHWVMSQGALAVMIPSPAGETFRGDVRLEDYASWLDGLVLEGGSDVWPGSYGETPIEPRWTGDRVRDQYEMALLRAFEAAGKPVFGVCRGLQLINVALGGTLVQDIPTQRPEAICHRDAKLYDRNFHHLTLTAGSWLEGLVGAGAPKVNSVHHQAVKDVAPGLSVEARCAEDGTVESLRRPNGPSYLAAVQWHPEFHRREDGVLDDAPILHDFLQAALAARTT